jgi:hypothetical protein
MPSEPPALAEARKASGRTMLAVENAARVKMSASIRKAVSVAQAGPPSVVVINAANRIEVALTADVGIVRAAARRESRATFAAELRAATGQPLLGQASRIDDTGPAAQAAKAYSAAWLASALDGLGDGTTRTAMERAMAGNDHRIDTMAISETAAQFSEERELASDAHAREAARQLLPVPLKLWWAELDRRTCPRCKALGYKIRPFGVPYPGRAIPGKVHRRCRCYESVAAFGVTYEDSEET